MNTDARSRLILSPEDAPAALPLHLLTERGYTGWLATQHGAVAAWLRSQNFQAERGRALSMPGAGGLPIGAIAGLGNLAAPEDLDLWHAAALADRLPPGDYRLEVELPAAAATRLALGWMLGCYRFQRYRSADKTTARARLLVPESADVRYVLAAADATALARDLINTPANDLGPEELTVAAAALAAQWGGELRVVDGETLAQDYPLIEAVGRGSSRAPRLIDLHFARPDAPRVVLVGKGVCFDSGGLDIKPASGMLLMKKDMGGAACALALAQLLLSMEAPLDLRVLVPAVENSVDANAFRPGDVCRSRKGLQVEIGNTDAEGRLVLADALTEAGKGDPELIIDLATLTGAARVALGAELPAVFSGDPLLLDDLQSHGAGECDPLWPLPLWDGYDDELGSRIADLNNVSSGGMAGAIMGALFLRRFVSKPERWIHVDLYAWNARDRPGRPIGAEAQAVRALYALLRQRLG
ncbi:MAG: leucyl aminopeptidase family protein [Pseudomonadota bacterium]